MKLVKEKIALANLGGKELTLNFFSLEDDRWLDENIEDANKRFHEFDFDVLLAVLWRLLDEPSKELIASVKLMQWEGLEKKPLVLTDPVDKLKRIVSGSVEIALIYAAIIQTRAKSSPPLQENAERKKQEGQS